MTGWPSTNWMKFTATDNAGPGLEALNLPMWLTVENSHGSGISSFPLFPRTQSWVHFRETLISFSLSTLQRRKLRNQRVEVTYLKSDSWKEANTGWKLCLSRCQRSCLVGISSNEAVLSPPLAEWWKPIVPVHASVKLLNSWPKEITATSLSLDPSWNIFIWVLEIVYEMFILSKIFKACCLEYLTGNKDLS